MTPPHFKIYNCKTQQLCWSRNKFNLSFTSGKICLNILTLTTILVYVQLNQTKSYCSNLIVRVLPYYFFSNSTCNNWWEILFRIIVSGLIETNNKNIHMFISRQFMLIDNIKTNAWLNNKVRDIFRVFDIWFWSKNVN